jgi:hypothetical protein
MTPVARRNLLQILTLLGFIAAGWVLAGVGGAALGLVAAFALIVTSVVIRMGRVKRANEAARAEKAAAARG